MLFRARRAIRATPRLFGSKATQKRLEADVGFARPSDESCPGQRYLLYKVLCEKERWCTLHARCPHARAPAAARTDAHALMSHHFSLPQAPASKTKVGDAVWLRGAAKGKDPFVQAAVINVQQNGCSYHYLNTHSLSRRTQGTARRCACTQLRVLFAMQCSHHSEARNR